MIYIDLLADLNLEDNQGRNVARLADAIDPDAVTPGAVLVAGAPRAWSWAVVESVDGEFVYLRRVSGASRRTAGRGTGRSAGRLRRRNRPAGRPGLVPDCPADLCCPPRDHRLSGTRTPCDVTVGGAEREANNTVIYTVR